MNANNKAVSNMTTDAPFRFLDLPGELRNIIYKMTLATSDRENPITVTSTGYARSGLLQTCKEVHAEAFRLHQLSNFFNLHIKDFNITPVIKFQEAITSAKSRGVLHQKDEIKTVVTRVYTTEKNSEDNTTTQQPWENLMNWLQQLHSGKTNFLLKFAAPEGQNMGKGAALRRMLDDMFQDAVDRRDMEWERLERVFEMRRAMIERADRGFGGSVMGFSLAGRDDDDDDGEGEW